MVSMGIASTQHNAFAIFAVAAITALQKHGCGMLQPHPTLM
jgi:hypothetical protein